jgi:hypothetical protein
MQVQMELFDGEWLKFDGREFVRSQMGICPCGKPESEKNDRGLCSQCWNKIKLSEVRRCIK